MTSPSPGTVSLRKEARTFNTSVEVASLNSVRWISRRSCVSSIGWSLGCRTEGWLINSTRLAAERERGRAAATAGRGRSAGGRTEEEERRGGSEEERGRD